MSLQSTAPMGSAGAFGVNYALRPHKFVDRRVFIEVIGRCAGVSPVDGHVYVGLGSFAMEDHKLMNASFGTSKMLSLEIDTDVLERQKFNAPLACINPTAYSTEDFVARKTAILNEYQFAADAQSIVWFDMTDATPLRANLDTFQMLLSKSQPGDIVRMTVDVDEKVFGRKIEGESIEGLRERQFESLKSQLGAQLDPKAKVTNLDTKLGIATLVVYAFKVTAEEAFAHNGTHTFEPISLTTYADGHRMLSVTGLVVERAKADEVRSQLNLSSVPGGAVAGWADLISIQLPQLTVWEKMMIDREIHSKTTKAISSAMNFKLHETVSTKDLLDGYKEFQRFYPTFRHVLL